MREIEAHRVYRVAGRATKHLPGTVNQARNCAAVYASKTENGMEPVPNKHGNLGLCPRLLA